MRSTITLNGINSNTIEGLLIQNLPPISKPLMRTQIEEIDGRDGDVITKLGFSAYNKEITIGLFGDFDINQIIQYFTSQGTVVFSNEPDKYYYYQIIDQIDFERLIRYRTATVTMHCQPFKYSTTEGTQVFDNSSNLLTIPNSTTTTNGVTVTANNNILTISGTASAATEFYIPIDTLSLSVGKYGMYALGSGTNPEACSLRVIYNSPSNANSFGGNYVTLKNNQTVSLIANLSNAKTYNYVYLYIAANKAMDFTLNLSIEDAAQSVVTGEGNLITLEGTAFAPFDKFDLKGDTTQQTYSGKNLFNINDNSKSQRSSKSIDGNKLTVTCTTAGTAYTVIELPNSDALLGKTCRLKVGNISVTSGSGTTQGMIRVLASLKTNLTSLAGDEYGQVRGLGDNLEGAVAFPNSYPDSKDCFVLVVYVGNRGGSTVVGEHGDYEEVQLELGSTATSYEPYTGGTASPNPDYPQEVQVVTGEQTVTITDGGEESQEYTVNLGSIELCKIGDYQDYIYKSGDDWYVRKEIGKIVLDGDGDYNTLGNGNGGLKRFRYTDSTIGNVPELSISTYCDIYQGIQRKFTLDIANSICQHTAQNLLLITTNSTTYTLNDFKTFLSNNPATVYYVLATPTDTKITDSSLIAQLETLVTDAHAYRNTTTLVSTSQQLPHIMSVEVAKNNDATITNSGNTTAKPVMTVYGSGTVGIYLNGNQIFNVNIGNNQYITIDTANMEAYKDTTDNLMNRLVDGDYSNFVLQTGENQISFSGSVSKLEISNYSRWI